MICVLWRSGAVLICQNRDVDLWMDHALCDHLLDEADSATDLLVCRLQCVGAMVVVHCGDRLGAVRVHRLGAVRVHHLGAVRVLVCRLRCVGAMVVVHCGDRLGAVRVHHLGAVRVLVCRLRCVVYLGDHRVLACSGDHRVLACSGDRLGAVRVHRLGAVRALICRLRCVVAMNCLLSANLLVWAPLGVHHLSRHGEVHEKHRVIRFFRLTNHRVLACSGDRLGAVRATLQTASFFLENHHPCCARPLVGLHPLGVCYAVVDRFLRALT